MSIAEKLHLDGVHLSDAKRGLRLSHICREDRAAKDSQNLARRIWYSLSESDSA
jgi:hypothetical protein